MREITYPAKIAGAQPLKVEFLECDEAVSLAASFLRLTIRSYGDQFEGDGKPLPSGTFQARYGTNKVFKHLRGKKIPSVYGRGGNYIVIRQPHDESQVSSALKILPGAELKPRFAGMSWIAQILTDPDYQRQGQGTALLHAHLTHAVAPESRLVLEAFDGNAVNGWYEKLGFEHHEAAGALELGRGLILPEHYMVTPEHIVASGVIARLEQQLS